MRRFNEALKGSILFFLISFSTVTQGQDKNQDGFKIVQPGFEFGMSYMNPEEINDMFTSWIESLGYLIEEGFSGGIHLGLSGAAFVAVRPVEFLELRPMYEVIYAPYLMWSSDGQRFNINILSHGPGFKAGFIAGEFRFGGGISHQSGSVQWNDLAFDNDDKWKGKTTGYNAYVGYNADPKQKLRYSISLEYQNVIFSQLLNIDNQIVTQWDSTKKLRLNLSGIALKFGYYLGR